MILFIDNMLHTVLKGSILVYSRRYCFVSKMSSSVTLKECLKTLRNVCSKICDHSQNLQKSVACNFVDN